MTTTDMRGGSNLNAKIGFQNEDKLKSQRLQEARVESKRVNQINLEMRKANDTMFQENKQHEKTIIKAARLDNYNKLCHLSS